ncbi:MAG: GNAT family protein [Candidatus Dormiibacterota bacterium]
MEGPDLRPPYLSGPLVYLRAPIEGDKETAGAWLDDTFPINSPRAEALLKEEYGARPGPRSRLRLMIVRRDGDRVVGGVRVSWGSEGRRCNLDFTMAPGEPDADSLRADALSTVVAWLRDQLEAMVVGVTLAADQRATVQAAEAVGMVRNGTLRAWFKRSDGRVDAVVYEALNPNWVVRDA